MSYILRKAVEERRIKLINILQICNCYQKEEQLSHLSLTELEEEYKRIQAESHPHYELESIRWKNKRVTTF